MTVNDQLQAFEEALANEEYDIAEGELDMADERNDKTEEDIANLRAARVKLHRAIRDLPNDY